MLLGLCDLYLVQPYPIFLIQSCNKSLFPSSRYGFRPITIFTATCTQEYISPDPCLGWLENPSKSWKCARETIGISNLRYSLLLCLHCPHLHLVWNKEPQDVSSKKSISFWMADPTTNQKAGLNLKFGLIFLKRYMKLSLFS